MSPEPVEDGRPSLPEGINVGIDVGGTFTDLVASTPEGIVVAKVPSTPEDPSRAFAAALDRAPGAPELVRHGTTVATNAVLTRTGAEVGLLTTRGFRHLLHLARQDRPSLYDLRARRSEPVVRTDRCIGVRERVGPDGTVLAALDENHAREALEALRGVRSVAVVLLHSYANASHERRLAELAGEVLGDVPVSVSSDVLPEFREYERGSTTALNAYVRPVVSRYLDRIAGAAPVRVGVMWSGGGVRSIARTAREPVHTLLSGPASGVLGAVWAARACGIEDVVTLDMGGTSADVALVSGGSPGFAEQSSIDGLPFRTPCVDVVTVGAGGGSIAWVDEGGALRVGPQSAGADPGPACYGRGGENATVTDAHVVMGYLGPEGLAGGEVELDLDAAVAATDRLCDRTGLDRMEAASGILRVVRATMGRAVRSVSVERGKDVRRYALVAFGGAGPLHATALARELGIQRVVVPPAPGALAALGLLVASIRSDASLSRPMIADPVRNPELRSILHDLTEEVLGELSEEEVSFSDSRVELAVDMRYEGQSHELRIGVEGSASFAKLAESFESTHEERYGFRRPSTSVEAVTFRAAALGPSGDVASKPPPPSSRAEPVARRQIGDKDAPIYERSHLGLGTRLEGPALVIETDSTTWIDERSVARVHPSGAFLVEVF